jgi:hypothetical protein
MNKESSKLGFSRAAILRPSNGSCCLEKFTASFMFEKPVRHFL